MPRKQDKTPQIRYEVEWCSSIPRDEHGDMQPDKAVYEFNTFTSFDTALAFARRLLKDRRDQFGCVPICCQEYCVNDDIAEHEGRTVMEWRDYDRYVVDDPAADVEPQHTGL